MRLPIPSFPQYEIDTLGNIYSNKRVKGYLIKPVLDTTGYYIVSLYTEQGIKTKVSVHSLLMNTFNPNPNPTVYKHINHIDGCKTNNDLSNLEWVIPKDNTNHAISIGLYNPKNHVNSKRVRQIKDNRVINTYCFIT